MISSILCDSLVFNSSCLIASAGDTLRILQISPETTGFSWVNFLKPSIDLLIALIGAFVLVWKYLTQKQKESAARIIESKRNAYNEFLKNFTVTAVKISHEMGNAGSYKHDKDRLMARNQLLLYANDKVIRAYHAWIEFSDQDEGKNINTEVELFSKMLLEIRKDIHGDSKLTENEISNLNPFNRG